MDLKTVGVKEDLLGIARKDGYLYAFHYGKETTLRILDIPEDSNYSIRYAEVLNNEISEIGYGRSGRDFRYDGRKEVDNYLISGVKLSNGEVLKIVLKYVYMIRPTLLDSTLLGFDREGVIEEDIYKIDPNRKSSDIQLSDGNIYGISICKGNLKIALGKEYIVEDFKLDEIVYKQSLYLENKHKNIMRSYRNYVNSVSFDVGGNFSSVFEEYKDEKEELLGMINYSFSMFNL